MTVWRDGKRPRDRLRERRRREAARVAPARTSRRPRRPRDRHPRRAQARSEVLRRRRDPARRPAATAAQQGRAAAGRDRHADDERAKNRPPTVETWRYEHGLRGYLLEALAQSSGAEPLIPLFEGAPARRQRQRPDDDGFADGEGADWVVAWTEDGALLRESYVNLIPTPAGGTHEAGLREGLFDAVKRFVDLHGLLPKGVRLLAGRRVRARVVRAVGEGARPAVPGADQGAAEQPRRGEARVRRARGPASSCG